MTLAMSERMRAMGLHRIADRLRICATNVMGIRCGHALCPRCRARTGRANQRKAETFLRLLPGSFGAGHLTLCTGADSIVDGRAVLVESFASLRRRRWWGRSVACGMGTVEILPAIGGSRRWNVHGHALVATTSGPPDGEMTGVSMLTATSQKPGGLDSGTALREYNDIASERFVVTALRWEDFYLDIAKKVVDMSRRMSTTSGGKNLSVKSPDGRSVKEFKWKEVDLPGNKFHMEVYSTAWLPTTPAARLQTITEFVKQGYLSQDKARLLLDYPDLESDTSLPTAAINDVDRTIEDILEEGEMHSADEFTNLALAVERGMSATLNAKWQGYPITLAATLINAMSAAPHPKRAVSVCQKEDTAVSPLVFHGETALVYSARVFAKCALTH